MAKPDKTRSKPVSNSIAPEGDKPHVLERANASVCSAKQDLDSDTAIQAARRGMKIYHNALARLAK